MQIFLFSSQIVIFYIDLFSQPLLAILNVRLMQLRFIRNQDSTIQLFGKKVLIGLLSLFVMLVTLQIAIQYSSYFQAFAQCLDPNNPRADYLITSEQQGVSNKFGSRIGTCIIDPKAVIGDFRQSSYQQLYEEFFERSKLPANQKTTPALAQGVSYKMTAASTLLNNFMYRITENFEINGDPTAVAKPTAIVFVEKDLLINSNFTYGDNTHGVVFIVRGSVYFNPSVTRFDGVIIAQGGTNNFSVCTAAPAYPACPTSAVNVGTDALIINGSIIAIDKPIYFTRRLRINSVNAAEQINHQVKYLAILNNLLARTTNIISENTTFAACSINPNDPFNSKKAVGCSCQTSTDCVSNSCAIVTGTTNVRTCQPSDSTASQGNVPAPTPTPTPPAPTPTSSPVPPRLVAHWTMDETSGSIVRDQIGGNTGSTPGSSIVAGRFGLARDLYNGSFITVNNSPAFQSQFMTVSTWVYPRDVSSSSNSLASIFDRRNAQNQYSFNMQLDGTGGIRCYANNASASSGATKLTVRAWNHVVCTYDGANIRVYIAGVVPSGGTTASPGVLSSPQNPSVQIGRNIGNSQSFIGYIDDLRVYSYALSGPEITALYTATANPGVPPTSGGWENPLKIFTEKLIPGILGI